MSNLAANKETDMTQQNSTSPSNRSTRPVVKIDEDKCDGCGLCVPSCAEGAIQIIDGKAKLLADNLCDGIGNCLGTCPRDAITIEQRTADEFDEAAVETHLKKSASPQTAPPAGGCPGMRLQTLGLASPAPADAKTPAPADAPRASALGHWPVQLSLLPEQGSLWDNADVVLAADCVAYALNGFHELILANQADRPKKTLAIACPKLDNAGAYVEKLARIFTNNPIHSLTVVRMEVPCCGLDAIVSQALQLANIPLPVQTLTVTLQGEIR